MPESSDRVVAPAPPAAAAAAAIRFRRRSLRFRVGSSSPPLQTSEDPQRRMNLAVPRDPSSADEEAVRTAAGTICPLREGSSRDGRGDSTRDEDEEGRGNGLRLLRPPPLDLANDDVSAFKPDAAISWRPCRARLKAVLLQERERRDKQNKFQGGGALRRSFEVERGRVQRDQRTVRRRRFGASWSVVAALRHLTLATLLVQWMAVGSPVAVEGVGVAHRSLLNTGNPDAKRLYDDLLSNYNKLVRPVVNVSEAVTVRLKLKLSQLIDVVSGDFSTG